MKKISKVLLAGLMIACTLLPFAGCKDKCKHDVGTWEVITPATCADKGKKQGICGKCLKTVKESIPKDPNNHPYGDWAITTMPTETETGNARKQCAESKKHILDIEMPVLNSVEYESKITARPTAGKDGERSYILKHEVGDLTFTLAVPATGVQTLRDAVDLGVAEESRSLIRKASGKMGWKFFNEENPTQPNKNFYRSHSYEFGDGYTHIVDGTDNCERWYFEEGEEIYGLTDFPPNGKRKDGTIYNDLNSGNGSEKYFDGSRFYLQYANWLGTFYGVEALLDGMYRSARWSVNDDFKEWTETQDGKTVYGFSFGSVENSGSASGYFAVVKTTFTLTSSYTVDTLNVEATIYLNNTEQGDADAIKAWDLDENGNAYVIAGKENGTRYVSGVEFTQKMKASTDAVPQNPHSVNKLYVDSFDILYRVDESSSYQALNGEGKTSEGKMVEFAADHNTGYIFSIGNVQPQDAASKYKFDDFKVYLRTKEGGQTVDLPIDEGTMNSVGMTVYLDEQTKQFYLNAHRAGERTVVVKTAKGVERVIACNISAATPSKLYPCVYKYENGQSNWVNNGAAEMSFTSFTYQEFAFTAIVPPAEKNYASAEHYVKITDANDKVVVNTNEKDTANPVAAEYKDVHWCTAGVKGGESAMIFAPTVEGTYKIEMRSTKKNTVVAKITLQVVKAPAFTELLENTYSQRLEYPDYVDVQLTFENTKAYKNDLQVDLTATDADKYVTTARISWGDGSFETLTCTYTLADRKLVSEHSGGSLFDEETGFVLGINDAGDFVLSHWVDIMNDWEKVVMRANPSA